MVTIEEIAKETFLSRYTVSKVLNGDLSVRSSTREKILKKCQEMGYIPNLNARNLVRGKSDLIGLIVPYTSDGFYSKLLEELELLAREKDHILIYKSSYNDPEREKEAIREFLSLKVCGLFIVPVVETPDKATHLLAARNCPLVYLDRPYSPGTFCVQNDNYKSAAEMTEKLLGRSPHIAFLESFYGEKNPTSAARKKGYKETMEKYGLAPLFLTLENSREGQDNEDYGYKVMVEAFRKKLPCKGVFCITDAAAMGAAKAVIENGFAPGKDFFIGGHDDLSFSNYMTPPLTTMAQPVRKISRKAFSLLFLQMQDLAPKKKWYSFSSRLIQRESC